MAPVPVGTLSSVPETAVLLVLYKTSYLIYKSSTVYKQYLLRRAAWERFCLWSAVLLYNV